MLFFSGSLELTGTNTKKTIVNNIGKSVAQNLRIIPNSNKVKSINDYNVLPVYKDIWLPKFKLEKNLILEGINPNDGTIQVKASVYVWYRLGEGDCSSVRQYLLHPSRKDV